NSDATVPSGFTNARYSPLAFRLKSVCSGAPGRARLFPEAKMTRKPLAVRFVSGRNHRAWRVGSSVSDQAWRFTVLAPVLYNSIQSGNWPSSSARAVLLSAMNSLIMTWPREVAATTSRQPNHRGKPTHGFIGYT